MPLCPECGEPPHYHSFCTRCAKLFRKPAARWNAPLRAAQKNSNTAWNIADAKRRAAHRKSFEGTMRELRKRDVMETEAALALGMSQHQLRVYCHLAGLPSFRRPPKRRVAA